MKHTTKYMILFAAAALVALPSCEQIEEGGPEIDPSENMKITFAVGGKETPETRSGNFRDIESSILPLGMDIENAEEIALATSFRLNVEESDLNEAFGYGAAVETKGTPVYTENLGDFIASAYLPLKTNGAYSSKFLDDATFSKSDDKWSYNYGSDKEWPEGGIRFFLRYPADDSSAGWTYKLKDGSNQISIEGYTTPGVGKTNAAELQKDLVFATELVKKADKDGVKILFYHPFCGVKFKLGDLPSGLTVKSVTISNVNSTGDCTITPYYGNGHSYGKTNSNKDGSAETRSAGCASWVSSTPKDFTQTFAATEQAEADVDADLFPAGFGDIAANQDQLNDASLSKTFILIPQKFDGSAKKFVVTLSCEYNGVTLTRSTEVTSAIEWKAGSLYTYTIKFNSEIDVEITDEVDGNVKHDVVITNTGNMPEYIRAAIIGNWFKDGKVVSGWNATQGNFDGFPGANWVKNGLFYYYTEPVAPGEPTPDALFNTYEPAEAPVAGAHFEMKIMVQAIIADDTVAAQSWGVAPSAL